MIAIAPTDPDWFGFLQDRLPTSEINFWTPTPGILMTLEELDSKLQEVDDACRLAQAELEALMRRQEHIEELEKDREALLKSMAEIVPEAREDLHLKSAQNLSDAASRGSPFCGRLRSWRRFL